MQGVQVHFLIRELDPAHYKGDWRSGSAATKTQNSQVNKKNNFFKWHIGIWFQVCKCRAFSVRTNGSLISTNFLLFCIFLKMDEPPLLLFFSPVQLFATPWKAACQASLSFTIFKSLLRFMSIESVMLSNLSSATLFSFCLQSFPGSGSFPMSWFITSGGQSTGASTSATVLSVNIQSWFPLGLTGFSLLFKWLSGVFYGTTVWKHQFFDTQPSLWSNSHIHTWP